MSAYEHSLEHLTRGTPEEDDEIRKASPGLTLLTVLTSETS